MKTKRHDKGDNRLKYPKIYLDNCCYNRPFDNQAQMKIRLETEAKLYIQANIREKVYSLCWSFMLDYENSKNPYDEIRHAVAIWKRIADDYCPPRYKNHQPYRFHQKYGGFIMRTDGALRYEAIDALIKTLGEVDTERFISMIKRDTFNYTEWRRGLWNDMTIEEIYAEASAHSKG
jgi:hypothetical protein